MSRTLAHFPGVVRRPRQSLAEMPLPDAIRHHARSQRIFFAGDPVGQCDPSAAGAIRDRIAGARQNRGEARRRFLTQAAVVPANEYMLLHRVAFFHRTGHVWLRRGIFLQRLLLGPELGDLRARLRREQPLLVALAEGEWTAVLNVDVGEEAVLV